jgi:hypothetical protein
VGLPRPYGKFVCGAQLVPHAINSQSHESFKADEGLSQFVMVMGRTALAIRPSLNEVDLFTVLREGSFHKNPVLSPVDILLAH